MWNMIWPIILVVGANTFYNICTKSMPTEINSFAALSISYFVAGVLSLGMFWVTGEQKNLLHELSKVNWTSVVLGISVVILEFGYICIYRAGWKVSIASLICNISLACMLLIVGIGIYKETITLRQVIGIVVCGVGLFLIGH